VLGHVKSIEPSQEFNRVSWVSVVSGIVETSKSLYEIRLGQAELALLTFPNCHCLDRGLHSKAEKHHTRLFKGLIFVARTPLPSLSLKFWNILDNDQGQLKNMVMVISAA